MTWRRTDGSELGLCRAVWAKSLVTWQVEGSSHSSEPGDQRVPSADSRGEQQWRMCCDAVLLDVLTLPRHPRQQRTGTSPT